MVALQSPGVMTCLAAGLQLRFFLFVALCSQLARTEEQTCFPPDFPFLYEDCCRDVQPFNNLPFMYKQCFSESYTWKRCCTFEFGPKLRGLPQMCSGPVSDDDGAITFSVGQAGLVRVFCTGLTLWTTMYYSARLLSDFEAVISASRTSWPAGHKSLEDFSGRKLHILDVGCGAGALSVTAAKLGHTFTAVDIDPDAVALSKKNMALNGLEPTDKAFMVWDMRTQPSDEMLAQGPWDIAFSEVATLLMMKFNEDSEYDLNTLNSIMADVLPTLFALPVKRFVFVGKYRQLYDQALTGIHWVTTSIMYRTVFLRVSVCF
eukprot:TRINITY_DN30146_c0_g1_i4.p1 TRINITY_DN30146_c0_g1~~TRINITY_DN30146_c0_g1_i4.p1  ORF type:complete len:318 (+),score=44.72 TRINITY_DN30146_c0_g1_i4:95-1048(+)